MVSSILQCFCSIYFFSKIFSVMKHMITIIMPFTVIVNFKIFSFFIFGDSEITLFFFRHFSFFYSSA